MKVDLGVVSTTDNDYDEVITKLDDIKERIKDTESELSDKGWTGEAQKKYNELVRWFISNEYELLEENLKCMKEILKNVVQSQGGALKNRCEDFVNCFDGSERGVYPETDGEIPGILSLEYDNSGSVIDNVTEITDRLIAHKRAALEDLSKTIRGGWFSSGLIFSSLNIDNELAESSNEIFNEEKRLNAFLQSFIQYTPGVKRLEESVCSGLNKIKDLSATVEQSIGAMNENINKTIVDKAYGYAKTGVIDVVGGGVTCVSGVIVVGASWLGIELTGGIAAFLGITETGTGVGYTMVVSGGNCTYNGLQDLKREWNGDWVEVGSTNVVKDTISDKVTQRTGNSTIGNLVGGGTMIFIDGAALKDGVISGGKDAVIAGKNTINDMKNISARYRLSQSSIEIKNVLTGDYVKLPPIKPINTNININSAALINGGIRLGTDYYKYGNAVYGGKTILADDTNTNINSLVNQMFGKEENKVPNNVIDWLERN